MKQTRPAFANLRILTGVVAVGAFLAAIAGYAGGRTGSGTAQRQWAPSRPSPHGSVTEAWVKRIDGPIHGNDHAHDVATDSAGNVLVTGWIETATGNEDCHTVKYSPAGDLLWENTYAGSSTGTDYGYALAVDQNGNTYVAGFGNVSNPAPYDIFVLKYDPDGNAVWTQRWTSPITNYSAYAYSIAVDTQGNVYTTGWMSDGFTDGEFITLKFNSTGDLQWATPYNGSTSSIDYANCIVVDGNGNSYITGWSGGANNLHDITTIKYDRDGNELWVRRYNGSADDNDYGSWLALDPSGNVYVTGQSVETGSDNDITTIKYAPNGNELWIRHYNGPANGYDAGQAIAVDSAGNAYVTGNHTTATVLECVTLKYSATGDLLWVSPFSGPDNDGVLISIALDDSANAYVSGFVFRGGASDWVTIKYDTNGVEQWSQLYDGPGNSSDGTYAMAVDNNRNVVVAGYSTGNGTDYDYTTIKYSQSGTPTPTPTPSCPPTETLYGGNGNQGGGALIIIDQTNGTGTLVGIPVPGVGLTGIAFDPDGRLFATTVVQGGTSTLIQVDPDTGSLITTIGQVTDNGTPISIGDLSFQPGTGVLYGVRSNADQLGGGGFLYTIDISTAVATFIGDTEAGAGGGLGFAPDGTLYQLSYNHQLDFSSLNTISPVDASRINTVATERYYDGLGLRPSDGVLFATPGGGSDAVYTVDTVSGLSTLIGNTGQGGVSDVDFRLGGACPTPTPTPTPTATATATPTATATATATATPTATATATPIRPTPTPRPRPTPPPRP